MCKQRQLFAAGMAMELRRIIETVQRSLSCRIWRDSFMVLVKVFSGDKIMTLRLIIVPVLAFAVVACAPVGSYRNDQARTDTFEPIEGRVSRIGT